MLALFCLNMVMGMETKKEAEIESDLVKLFHGNPVVNPNRDDGELDFMTTLHQFFEGEGRYVKENFKFKFSHTKTQPIQLL